GCTALVEAPDIFAAVTANVDQRLAVTGHGRVPGSTSQSKTLGSTGSGDTNAPEVIVITKIRGRRVNKRLPVGHPGDPSNERSPMRHTLRVSDGGEIGVDTRHIQVAGEVSSALGERETIPAGRKRWPEVANAVGVRSGHKPAFFAAVDCLHEDAI